MALMTLSRSIDPERGGRPRSRPSTALAISFNVVFASSRTIMRLPYSFNALSSTIAVASCLSPDLRMPPPAAPPAHSSPPGSVRTCA